MSLYTELASGAKYDLNAGVTANVDAAVAAAAGLRLVGFVARESAVTPGANTFTIVHGATAAGGDAVVPVSLDASADDFEYFGKEGIAMPNGISILLESGEVDVTILYRIAD